VYIYDSGGLETLPDKEIVGTVSCPAFETVKVPLK